MVDLNYQNALISADRPSMSAGHECFLKKKPKQDKLIWKDM